MCECDISYVAKTCESSHCNLQMSEMGSGCGWLCFTSHRQRGHLEMASPFTVPCEAGIAQR